MTEENRYHHSTEKLAAALMNLYYQRRQNDVSVTQLTREPERQKAVVLSPRSKSVTFGNYINLAQMLISIILIVVVLLQTRGTDVGAAFGGGGGGGSTFRTRRGLEKTLFQLTIVLAVIFVGISALSVHYGR